MNSADHLAEHLRGPILLTQLSDAELLLATLIMLRTLGGFARALSENARVKSKNSPKERNNASSKEKTSDEEKTQTESDERSQR